MAEQINPWRFCIAPMMDWTDRHDRFFLRLITRHARLYTEMITTGALLHGDRSRFLRFDATEHPVALQLGGSDPDALARCAEFGAAAGYDEINLNCGCPSDRVQGGGRRHGAVSPAQQGKRGGGSRSTCGFPETSASIGRSPHGFGACLMLEPQRVAQAVAAMRAVTGLPVTVKCRIGVDDSEDYAFLKTFVETIAAAGCTTFIVHARKAWLSGLSPKENREIPPLDYPAVHRLKQDYPALTIVLNGGLRSLDLASQQLLHVDGVMLGREAYENPYLLASVDARFFGCANPAPAREDVVRGMFPHIERELAAGGSLAQITRHILGIYRGQPGGRGFRRVLSQRACRAGAGIEVLEAALAEVSGTLPALEAA